MSKANSEVCEVNEVGEAGAITLRLNIRSAILSIDLQNEYRSTGAYPVAGYDRILANAR